MANLNKIVWGYKINKEYKKKTGRQLESELRTLRERLTDVPVTLKKWEGMYGDINFLDLQSFAELEYPEIRIFLLDDCLTWEEANEVTEQMELPYTRIYFSGESYSKNFSKRYKLEEVILPRKNSKELEEPTKIIKSGNAIGIIYKNKKNNKLRYIEMYLLDGGVL